MKLIKDFEIEYKALYETCKEALRLGVFAFASAVLAFILKKLEIMDQSEALVMFGTLALRIVDKLIHEKSKLEKGWDGGSHGLVRF